MKFSPAPRTLHTRTASLTDAMTQLPHRSQEAAALLKALANPDRLLLLCHLLGTERTVAELREITGIAQPTLSQQLAVLRNEELVATRREGKFIHYRVASPAVRAVLRTLHRLYCEPGSAAIR